MEEARSEEGPADRAARQLQFTRRENRERRCIMARQCRDGTTFTRERHELEAVGHVGRNAGCGCASMAAPTPPARVALAATAGNQASGSITFQPTGERLRVVARVTALAPGAHGFHIYEKGDCSAPDATSAGGHFNPTSNPHGDPAAADHHGADMSMLTADAGRMAVMDVLIDTVTIGGSNDIVGRAVIVHKDADDYKTQPTGNSGARVACGVIVRA
jgi:superoxide dismutase, Cu-Zn family